MKFTTPSSGVTTALEFSAFDFAPGSTLYAADVSGNVLCYTTPINYALRTMHTNCKYNNAGGATDPNIYTMTLTNTIATDNEEWLTITTLNAAVLTMPTDFNPNYATFKATADDTVVNPILYRSPPKHFKSLIIE
jgi:hypothetical protein